MSNKEMGQIWLATKPGAYSQALDLAAQSDRLAQQDEKPGIHKRKQQDGVDIVWGLLPWVIWVLAVALFAITLETHSR